MKATIRQTAVSLGVARGARPYNMLLRFAVLGSRFVFTLYVAKGLGIDDLGVYGFVMGLIMVVPPVTGWGLNYFITRKVVGLPLDDAAIIVRNRLAVTVLSIAPVLMLIPLLGTFGIAVSPTRIALVAALVFVETISADLQPPLISMGMSLFANVLVFIRASPWVGIFILMSMLSPTFKTLDFALWLWIIFDIVQFLLVYLIILKRADLGRIISAPLRIRKMLSDIKMGLSVYPNDVGNVVQVYVDRYIVGAMLNLHDLGIFTLYWSIANSVNAIITSAITQPATPVLMHAHTQGDHLAWETAYTKLLTGTVLSGLALGLGAMVAAWAATSFLHIGEFQANYIFLLALLAAATLRSLSEALNLGLASRYMDRAYCITGLLGMLLAALFSFVGLSLFGLKGVALAGCATQLALVVVKMRLIRLHSSPRSPELISTV